MTAIPYLILFFAGSMLTLAIQACIAMWRNPRPPEGHHYAQRNGRKFVRRNPSKKQLPLLEVPSE